MRKKTAELIDKLHIIIDDVRRTGEDDDFAADKDAELREALLTGAEQVTAEAPTDALLATDVLASLGGNQDYDAIQTQYTDGHGTLVVPEDFLRIVELRLKSWSQTVTSLMEAESQEAQMQACRWTRGTPQKPKARLSTDSSGNRVVVYWTAGRYQYPSGEALTNVYDHKVERFTYASYPRFETEAGTEYLYAPLTDGCERAILYRAAGVFMEAKKEIAMADRFYQLGRV